MCFPDVERGHRTLPERIRGRVVLRVVRIRAVRRCFEEPPARRAAPRHRPGPRTRRPPFRRRSRPAVRPRRRRLLGTSRAASRSRERRRPRQLDSVAYGLGETGVPGTPDVGVPEFHDVLVRDVGELALEGIAPLGRRRRWILPGRRRGRGLLVGVADELRLDRLWFPVFREDLVSAPRLGVLDVLRFDAEGELLGDRVVHRDGVVERVQLGEGAQVKARFRVEPEAVAVAGAGPVPVGRLDQGVSWGSPSGRWTRNPPVPSRSSTSASPPSDVARCQLSVPLAFSRRRWSAFRSSQASTSSIGSPSPPSSAVATRAHLLESQAGPAVGADGVRRDGG